MEKELNPEEKAHALYEKMAKGKSAYIDLINSNDGTDEAQKKIQDAHDLYEKGVKDYTSYTKSDEYKNFIVEARDTMKKEKTHLQTHEDANDQREFDRLCRLAGKAEAFAEDFEKSEAESKNDTTADPNTAKPKEADTANPPAGNEPKE